MNIVSTKEISNIRYLLGSSVTAPNMYRQIRATFPDSTVYMIFAEPIVLEDGRKIDYGKFKPVLFEQQGFRYVRTGEPLGPCIVPGREFAARE